MLFIIESLRDLTLRYHLVKHLFIFGFSAEPRELCTLLSSGLFCVLYYLSILCDTQIFFLSCHIFSNLSHYSHIIAWFHDPLMEQESSKKQEQCPCKALQIIIASISEYILYFIYIIFFIHVVIIWLIVYYVILCWIENISVTFWSHIFLKTINLHFLRPGNLVLLGKGGESKMCIL